jgi:hypothetical protein
MNQRFHPEAIHMIEKSPLLTFDALCGKCRKFRSTSCPSRLLKLLLAQFELIVIKVGASLPSQFLVKATGQAYSIEVAAQLPRRAYDHRVGRSLD